MENQENELDVKKEQETKIEKVSIKDIKKDKEDEIVDNIMSKILQIK